MTDKYDFISDRRKFLEQLGLLGASVAALPLVSYGETHASSQRFTILHTNDMHSNFTGVGPLLDYTPLTQNNDATIGGYARLAALIAERRGEMEKHGPVLVLDAGDYTMGTAFGAASRELGAELRLMGRMGYDAVTLGNHELDLGPDGLAAAISKALDAGAAPAVVASNTELGGGEQRLGALRELSEAGVIRRHTIIERNSIRFGIIGLMGYDASKYTIDPGGLVFTDPLETAREVARELRADGSADVVIALSHGGVIEGEDGHYTGEDIQLLDAVPEIDIVVGGHTHNRMLQPELIGDRPVVQSGRYGEHLGELVVRMEDAGIKVESYRVIPVDDRIQGDATLQADVETLLKASSDAVFAPRGYSLTQPLAVIDRDWPMDFADHDASTPLANLVSDALREATGADVGFTVNGLIRASLLKGKTGVQTAYDVFALTPLGNGIVDDTAGSAMVKGYFTGRELKNVLEFFLIDDPVLPGQYFPRVSGMRFTYDPARPRFQMVEAIEIGDLDTGYRRIDISETSEKLYSFACPVFAGEILVSIPKLSGGALPLTPKKEDGSSIESRVDALVDPRQSTSPYLLETNASIEAAATVTDQTEREIKEWQAIMDHIAAWPKKSSDGLALLTLDERATEVRATRL